MPTGVYIRIKKQSVETKAKRANSLREVWTRPGYKEKVGKKISDSLTNRHCPRTEKQHRQAVESCRALSKNPEYVKKAKESRIANGYWKDPVATKQKIGKANKLALTGKKFSQERKDTLKGVHSGDKSNFYIDGRALCAKCHRKTDTYGYGKMIRTYKNGH